MSNNKKALVIDGNSLFYRCYYATSELVELAKQKNYTPNNAIKLMINMIIKLLTSNKYNYFFIAFDNKQKSFRHTELKTYKQNRTKAPDDLYLQLDDTIKCLNALGITTISKPGFEADDLIGSFTKITNQNQIETDIITSDKDMLQLINDFNRVLLTKRGIHDLDEIDNNNFKSKFNDLTPLQIIDLKAIVGDSSDNIKGINGVGNKTAINLLNKYSSIDNIYNNIHELPIKLQQKFIDSKQDVFLYLKIIKIMNNGLDEYNINDFILKDKDIEVLKNIVKKYHLKQLKEFLLI